MADVTVDENVLVGMGGNRELRADVFRHADTSGPVPGIILFPGGAWQTANRASQVERYGYRMAERGYVTVAAEYRVINEASWPAQIQDVKACIRWLRANSKEMGVDPSRILISGASAGGQLVLVAAGSPGVAEFEGEGGNAQVSSDVCAVIALYPVTDMIAIPHRPGWEKFFGESPDPELVRGASPISYAAPNFPPTMLVHGTADTTVHHTMTTSMYHALEKAGVPVDLHLYAGQDHIFDQNPQFSEPIADAMALFIERYVTALSSAAAN